MALLVPFISGTSLGLPSRTDLGSDSIFARSVNFIVSLDLSEGVTPTKHVTESTRRRGALSAR